MLCWCTVAAAQEAAGGQAGPQISEWMVTGGWLLQVLGVIILAQLGHSRRRRYSWSLVNATRLVWIFGLLAVLLLGVMFWLDYEFWPLLILAGIGQWISVYYTAVAYSRRRSLLRRELRRRQAAASEAETATGGKD